MKMWGGRFGKEPEEDLLRFTASIGFDMRLCEYDLECTREWSVALRQAGVLTDEEEAQILIGLQKVAEEVESGSLKLYSTDEDVHTFVERRLVEILGATGGKIRTGRSRNDQVATDLRLFTMDACEEVCEGIVGLQKGLVGKAEENLDVVIPGQTHLQQAQPVLLSHLLMSYVSMLDRDYGRLKEARNTADSMPLGSGAFAGTTLDIDRDSLARRLGFSGPCDNSVDGVSDRDFVCDTIYAISLLMVHLSRLSEQVILWCSQEFGLAELDDSWSTGSSLMPQKKNPDALELVRGKSGRVTGSLVSVMMMLKGLPLAYNRDLQEDKEPLFDAVDTARGSLGITAGVIAGLSFNRERVCELMSGGFLTATDLADFLAEKGMDFPTAHEVVGKVVSHCLERGKELADMSLPQLRQFSELFDAEAIKFLSVEESVNRRSCTGGTCPQEVERQIREARRRIEKL